MDDRKFEVCCNASVDGQFQVRTHSLSVAIGQWVNLDKCGEMWQSVLIICEETADGSLTTRVIVCHPEWDQNLQIACIRSRITAQDKPAPAFELDLKSVHV
jgi:hypothetical protein